MKKIATNCFLILVATLAFISVGQAQPCNNTQLQVCGRQCDSQRTIDATGCNAAYYDSVNGYQQPQYNNCVAATNNTYDGCVGGCSNISGCSKQTTKDPSRQPPSTSGSQSKPPENRGGWVTNSSAGSTELPYSADDQLLCEKGEVSKGKISLFCSLIAVSNRIAVELTVVAKPDAGRAWLLRAELNTQYDIERLCENCRSSFNRGALSENIINKTVDASGISRQQLRFEFSTAEQSRWKTFFTAHMMNAEPVSIMAKLIQLSCTTNTNFAEPPKECPSITAIVP